MLSARIRSFFGVHKEDSGISEKDLVQNFHEFLKEEQKVNPAEFPQLLKDLKSSLKEKGSEKDIEVNDPEEVKADPAKKEAAALADDEQPEATSEASEATKNSSTEVEEVVKAISDNTDKTVDKATLVGGGKDPEVVAVPVKDIDTPESLLKEKITDFDLEKNSYNEIKAFAADVSDFTGEDPDGSEKGDFNCLYPGSKKKAAGQLNQKPLREQYQVFEQRRLPR